MGNGGLNNKLKEQGEATMAELRAAVRSWLASRDLESPKTVAWFSVGIVASDTKVTWKTEPIEEYWKDWELKLPAEEVFEALEIYTKKDEASLANQSLKRFKTTKNNELNAPFLYREFKKKHGTLRTAPGLVTIEMSSGEPSEMSKALGTVVPDGCTTMLFPIILWHGDEPSYVGAVVICARISSRIFAILPELKALVLPLAEPLRHAPEYGIPPSAAGASELILLRTLISGGPVFRDKVDHRFEEVGARVKTKQELAQRFQYAAELLGASSCCENREWFPTCCVRAFEFCKSLFYFEKADAKNQISRPLWKSEGEREWALRSAGALLGTLGEIQNRLIKAPGKYFRWPSSPGLIGAVLVSRLARKLDATKVEIVSGEGRCGVRITTRISTNNLSRKLWESALGLDSSGDIRFSIFKVMRADLQDVIHHLLKGKQSRGEYWELFQAADKLVAYPEFDGKSLTLWWEVDTSKGSVSPTGLEGKNDGIVLSLFDDNAPIPELTKNLKEACAVHGIEMVPGGIFPRARQIIVAHSDVLWEKIMTPAPPKAIAHRCVVFFGSSTGCESAKGIVSYNWKNGSCDYQIFQLKTKLAEVDCGKLVEIAIEMHGYSSWPQTKKALAIYRKRVAGSVRGAA